MAFTYKRILVLGATSGIGLVMAERFVENGAKVIVVGRREDRLAAFVSRYGEEKAHYIAFDLSQTDKIPAFVNDVTERFSDIDCVYYNAGTQRPYDLANGDGWDLKTFNEEVNLNFTSAVSLVHAFLPFLKAQAEKQPSSLMFTGTNLAIIPAAWVPAYSASKSALNVFVLTLREQLKHSSKLKVIEISPSAVQTEIRHHAMGDKGTKVGMPLDQFANEAFSGLQQGLDQIIVGAAPNQAVFDNILKNRREQFENLAAMWRKQFLN